MTEHNKYYLISLGCAKNTVDSESMSMLLDNSGYQLVDQPGNADVLIVNTCGFIQLARLESIKILQDLNSQKKENQILIAAGCMSQRHQHLLTENIPGIDGIIGTHLWADIVGFVQKIRAYPSRNNVLYHLPDVPLINWKNEGVMRAAIQGGSAYIKIADGCRRNCAFCAIPLIKGTSVSRPMDDILNDVISLQESGIKEIILIAQDTTDYGTDLRIKDGLTNILKRIVTEAPLIPWVRLLYAFPGYISDTLIDLMMIYPQILHYIDLPLQHAHPDVLRRMNRPSKIEGVLRTLEKIRSAMPDVAIRTTFIVGYPGETDKEFQALLDFINNVRFDHVGVFTYSHENGTPSNIFPDDISPDLKQERLSQLMSLQEKISLERNQVFIGKKLNVLVEGRDKQISVGRSYRDAPEIDGLVIFEGKANIGEIVPVRIHGALTYDLTGKLDI